MHRSNKYSAFAFLCIVLVCACGAFYCFLIPSGVNIVVLRGEASSREFSSIRERIEDPIFLEKCLAGTDITKETLASAIWFDRSEDHTHTVNYTIRIRKFGISNFQKRRIEKAAKVFSDRVSDLLRTAGAAN